jgi:antitoxin HicB
VKYRALILQDEDGLFVAEAPALPRCVSQGDTRAKALKNIREAVELYLENLEAHGEAIPPPITEEVIEIAA